MFVTNWISPTKIQKISEITNFFRHYFLSRTEVTHRRLEGFRGILICLEDILVSLLGLYKYNNPEETFL